MTELTELLSYHARQLGCGTALLETAGLHIIPSANRQYPDSRGRIQPVLGVRLGDSGTISVHPHYYLPVRDIIGSYNAPGPVFTTGFAQRVREALHRELPPSVVQAAPLCFFDRDSLRPDPVSDVERLTGASASATMPEVNWDVFQKKGETSEHRVQVGVFATNEPVWLLVPASTVDTTFAGELSMVLQAAALAVSEAGRIAILHADNIGAGTLEEAGFVRYGVELSIGYKSGRL